jgi:hypothetical protein
MSFSVDQAPSTPSQPSAAEMLRDYCKAGAVPDPGRALELFVLLAELAIQMEETVASQFPRKALAAGEAEENKGLSQEVLGQYLCMNNADPARAKLKSEIDRQLKALGYRVWSMMRAMESLPRRYAKTRAPAAIEEAPEMTAGGGGFFRADNKFKKYWEKYTELCGGRDNGTLVKNISDLYSQILVEILQARAGSPDRAADSSGKAPS